MQFMLHQDRLRPARWNNYAPERIFGHNALGMVKLNHRRGEMVKFTQDGETAPF